MSFYHLLFNDLKDFHGAGLDADATGDTLGSGALGLQDHNVHGAGLNTGAAADTQLLVDHVHTGLGVLGNGTMLAGAHALTTLNTHIGLGGVALGHDANAAQILVKVLVKSLGTSLNTLQASHTFGIFLNNQLLHKKRTLLFHNFYHTLYINKLKNQRFFTM